MQSNKEDLRAHFRAIRNQLTPAFRATAAQTIAERFISLPLFIQSQHIACYFAFRNEVDCLPLIQRIWQANKKCYLPVLAENKVLRFCLYQPNDVLQQNQYGILEPLPTALSIELEKLDVVITPLVAFDRAGHRLGAGGGYYDRTFSGELSSRLIGVGYAAQETILLPCDEHDVTLCGVVTEKEMIGF